MRKRYYIKPKIQKAFTIVFTLIVAVEMIIFGGIFYLSEQVNLNKTQDIEIYIRFITILLLTLIFSSFNFLLGTRLSHRIVGPLVQIQRALDNALHGNYKSRVRMRSKDYLHDIGDKINLLLERFEQYSHKKQKDETVL